MDLKTKLKKQSIPVAEINKFLAYVTSEKNKEKGKDKQPVTGNTDDMLYTMFVKFWNLGLTIDGTNVVITGKAMAMVTFHGYKNKVLATYPNAIFDVQLVREGDKFNVGKVNGKVTYTHDITDPFGEADIKGAYCVITIGENSYFEALNKKDFESMKGGSKQSYLWKTWDSEFWLKSVIKRACKRHFYNEVKDIDVVDNEDYGQPEKPKKVADEESVTEAIKLITESNDLDTLKSVFVNSGLMAHEQVIAAKDERKAQLQKNESN